MKALRTVLYVFSYISQYLMPIILFGIVVPFYHGAIGPGMTGAGIIFTCLALSLAYRKIEKKIDDSVKGVWHGALLSLFPIIVWIVLGIGIQRVLTFVNTLIDYWWIAFIFILIGRICATVADAMEEKDG